MLYQKNVPAWERIIRSIVGVVLIAYGLIAMKGLPLGYLVVLSGVIAMLTGFVGFCPMCALAGRRIQFSLKDDKKA